MAEPDSDPPKRQHWPPSVWFDEPKHPGKPPPYPPITRRVTLPESVTVAYIAELIGKDPASLLEQFKWLQFYYTQRALNFQEAAWLLRNYGIGADRENP